MQRARYRIQLTYPAPTLELGTERGRGAPPEAQEASPSLGVQVLLRERGDGSVLGYISGEPGVYLAQGSVPGRAR